MDLALSTYLNASGLSAVGQEYFKCFSRFGIRTIPVWLFEPDSLDSLNPDLVQRMMSLANILPESPLQFHAGLSSDVRLLKDRYASTASIVLEGDRLTGEQAQVCNGVDVVFSPSFFCRNTCVSSGVPKNKIFHLPYPLDSKTWNTNVQTVKQEKFRFLYMNSCYERKGWDLLLRAFWEEFSAEENVELTMKSYRENDRPEHLDILVALEASKLGISRNRRAHVQIMDDVMPADSIPSFMKSFDAYISPHRSEGFGLNIWHAMALGVPVISTNYGGCVDFVKDDTAWPVKVAKMIRPGAREIGLFNQYKDISWAEPDLADLKRQMRSCFENKEEAENRARKGASYVASQYSYQTVMDCFERALRKALPGAWEKLGVAIDVEALSRQPMPKFESADIPFKMAEI